VRPTVAEVDLSAIRENVRAILRKVSPARVMAVVKADAYGHGAIPVAKAALQAGASSLAVAMLEEALELREAGISAPILVFGGALPQEARDYLRHGLTATLYTRESLLAFAKEAKAQARGVKVHIKVDTGMGRVGVPWEEALRFVQEARATPGVEVEGIYTHLATSDERDKTFAFEQLTRFRQVLRALEEANVRGLVRHAANSGAILDLPEAYFDLVRPGIMMYGYYPSAETSESVAVRPAMTFKTRVIYLKEVPAGTPISYGRTYLTPRATRIATLPVGYADGYNRLLSNCGEVLIRGRRYPVVGRVCMDQILVDVGLDSPVEVGDEVVLFGRQGDAELSVRSICEKLNTIPYEVTCWVSKRVPRVYLNG